MDSAGAVYVTGTTDTNFPATSGAFQPGYGGRPHDAFVGKLGGAPVVTQPGGFCFGRPGEISGHETACPYGLLGVELASGNQVWQERDLRGAAPALPFDWTRTYNSQDTSAGPLGRGWSGRYLTHLDLSTANVVTAILENGARSIYTLSGGTYQAPAGEYATLTHNTGSNTYTLLRPDQTQLVFNSTGQVQDLWDEFGNHTHLGYAGGLLARVTDPVGQVYTITTGSGLITGFRDSLNRTTVYTYTATVTGTLLTEVQDVNGHVIHYYSLSPVPFNYSYRNHHSIR